MSMQLIETIEVGSGGAASIEFTSIPQDGVDLVCVASVRADGSEYGSVMALRLNGDSGANYTTYRMYGGGSSVVTDEITSSYIYRGWKSNGTDFTTNTFASNQLYISNYTSTSAKFISFDSITITNGANAEMTIAGAKYTGTSGISSILIAPLSNGFVQYSTASLYKITAD